MWDYWREERRQSKCAANALPFLPPPGSCQSGNVTQGSGRGAGGGQPEVLEPPARRRERARAVEAARAGGRCEEHGEADSWRPGREPRGQGRAEETPGLKGCERTGKTPPEWAREKEQQPANWVRPSGAGRDCSPTTARALGVPETYGGRGGKEDSGTYLGGLL